MYELLVCDSEEAIEKQTIALNIKKYITVTFHLLLH